MLKAIGHGTLAAVVAAAALASTDSAHAQQTPSTSIAVEPARPSEVRVRVGESRGEEDSKEQARPRRRRSSSDPPTPKIVSVTIRVNAQTGLPCASLRMVNGDPNSALAANNEMQAIQLAEQYGICPDSPRQANGAFTPAAAAAMIWEDSVELPDPILQIKPGHAITGKPAYLEVVSPRTITTTTSAFGHAVELNVTSVLDIDWGDGTVERNVTRKGGAWPSGDITHVYTNTNPQQPVHVTQRWKATWRVGNLTGTIADQLFTESTLQLPVRELQAVRER